MEGIMRTLHRTAAGALGIGALAIASGCGAAGEWTGARAEAVESRGVTAAARPAAPVAIREVLVGCEPHQQTLIRQTLVRGREIAQVECVDNPDAGYAAAPVHHSAPVYHGAPAYHIPPQTAPAPGVMPAVVTAPAAAPRAARTNPAPAQSTGRAQPRKRSTAKSAVIIASSAGAGAGVGAAVGGKKGALIGAAVGGGSAVVWDQATRNPR
jgi:hypothetical protein